MSALDTRDNRDALRAAIAAGDDVEFSTTGLTLWRVESREGYDPRDLATRLGIDLACPECIEHPGWAHGDESRRKYPADYCKRCLGSGVDQD